MTVLIILLVFLTVAAFGAGGQLRRIADALEAQNEHYGVGVESD